MFLLKQVRIAKQIRQIYFPPYSFLLLINYFLRVYIKALLYCAINSDMTTDGIIFAGRQVSRETAAVFTM